MSDVSPQTESSNEDDEEIEQVETPDKKFYEKIGDYNSGERDTNPIEELPQWKIWTAIASLAVVVVLGFGLLATGNTGASFLVFAAPFIGTLLLTKGGREFLRDIQEEMENGNQQQQATSGNESKKVCPDCGWQNPKEGNFCHDCGSELS